MDGLNEIDDIIQGDQILHANNQALDAECPPDHEVDDVPLNSGAQAQFVANLNANGVDQMPNMDENDFYEHEQNIDPNLNME